MYKFEIWKLILDYCNIIYLRIRLHIEIEIPTISDMLLNIGVMVWVWEGVHVCVGECMCVWVCICVWAFGCVYM